MKHRSKYLIQTHVYINLVTDDKAETLSALTPVFDDLRADEIDTESFANEIRFYFDDLEHFPLVSEDIQTIEKVLSSKQS